MGLRFTVLASGSAGNCSVVQSESGAILLDAGLGLRLLFERLSQANIAPDLLRGMLLTHTHTDHWNEAVLTWLADRRLPLFCHPSHHTLLSRAAGFRLLATAGLVRDIAPSVEIVLPAGMRAWPVPVRHDGGATFGYRIEGPGDLFGSSGALGFATDLGIWDEDTLRGLGPVDVLALEFNHDLALERRSSRPAFLIERVLGDHGHLSNDQAADFVREYLKRHPGRLRHIVQLHLSGDCNRPALARQAVATVLNDHDCDAKIHTAAQNTPLKTIVLTSPTTSRTRGSRSASVARKSVQPLLPGLEA